MKLKIDLVNNTLTITADNKERNALRKMREANSDEFDSDSFMYELLENLVTNDCFQWLPNGVTADLTSGPMLGVLGEEEIGPSDYHDANCTGLLHVGCWDDEQRYQPVLYRWVFMNYAVTSLQRELIDTGEAILDGGVYIEREGQMGFTETELEFTGRVPVHASFNN